MAPSGSFPSTRRAGARPRDRVAVLAHRPGTRRSARAGQRGRQRRGRDRYLHRAAAAELLIDLVGKNNYQLIVNLEKVGFLDSTGLGVLVGGLKRVRAHDGSLDLVCTQERILKIFKITGLTKVFGIYQTVDQAIAARK